MHHGRRDDIHLHRCGDSYTEVVAPIDHAWGEPVWEWAEDYSSATATFICERGCGYQEVFTDREIASEETQHASCTQEGKFDHTASVTFNGNEYTDTVTQTTPFVHVTSEAGEYTLGNEHHWKRCTLCGATVKEEHVFEDGAQNCSVCGVTNGSNFYFSAVSGGYSVKQNGKPTFTDTVVLPEYYEAESGDMPITQIGTYGFEWNDSFESIIIPDSVTKIGNYAFQYCRSLKNITLPDSVTSIGDQAFRSCKALTSVTLPENSQFMTISSSLFIYCRSLASITISDSVTTIGDQAFSSCKALTSATLPENSQFTTISTRLFEGCIALETIVIPASVTSIGAEAFSECGLKSITIPANVTSIGTQAFESCNQLKSVTFADADAEWTISDNEIFIPDNDDPAANAAALTTTYVSSYWSEGGTHVHTAGSEWVTDGDNHWKECIVCGAEMDKEAHKFSSAEYVMGNEHHWKECIVCGAEEMNKKEDHFYNGGKCTTCGVTAGHYFSFSEVSGGASVVQNGMPSFTATVVLPEYYEAEDGDIPVMTIGNSAFAGNTTFTTITLPDSVTSIGSDAFANCYTLKSVTLPTNSQFTTISDNLFEECYMLTSITIPDSVTSIGEWAFGECGDLATVTIPEDSSLLRSATMHSTNAPIFQ